MTIRRRWAFPELICALFLLFPSSSPAQPVAPLLLATAGATAKPGGESAKPASAQQGDKPESKPAKEWYEVHWLALLLGSAGAITALWNLFTKTPIDLIGKIYSLQERIRTLRRCHSLIRRYHEGEDGGGKLAALKILRETLGGFNGFRTCPPDKIVERTRRRIEHGIFRPRPEFSWPLSEDHPDYDEQWRGEDELRSRHAAREIYWQRYIGNIHKNKQARTIRVRNPGSVTRRQKDIQRYFHILQAMGFERTNRFINPIAIKNGFIAPLHLLSGLLVHFGEKWPTIIDSFNIEARMANKLAFGRRPDDLRQIQLFIYNCWLLWGPSIPICSHNCRQWRGDLITMQYGFGDESNSIDIVGASKLQSNGQLTLLDQVQSIVDEERKRIDDENESRVVECGDGAEVPMRRLSAMAVPATVTGYLRHSSSFKARSAAGKIDIDEGSLPLAVRKSLEGRQDERALLYVDKVELDKTEQDELPGLGVKANDSEIARYYSGYIWVAFTMLENVAAKGADRAIWKIGNPGRLDTGPGEYMAALDHGSSKPWLDLIPFFEHGNIGDSETCAFLKRQLARKILSGFLELLEQLPVAERSRPRHRFAYTCAIDDPGCGENHFLMPHLSGGETVKAIMRRLIKEDARYQPLHPLVKFTTYNSEHHPLAACTLPGHIDRHYQEMAQQERDMRRYRAEKQQGYKDYFDDDPYWEEIESRHFARQENARA